MLTNEGRKMILTEFLTPAADAKTVHLLQDLPADPIAPMVWQDVTEADFDGYAPIPWAGEGAAAINGAGQAQWNSETELLEWTRTTTGAAQEIKAICLTCTIGVDVFLIDVTRFDPVTVTNEFDEIKRSYNAYADNLVV